MPDSANPTVTLHPSFSFTEEWIGSAPIAFQNLSLAEILQRSRRDEFAAHCFTVLNGTRTEIWRRTEVISWFRQLFGEPYVSDLLNSGFAPSDAPEKQGGSNMGGRKKRVTMRIDRDEV